MGPESMGRAGRALGYWMRRQEAVAHNLANADTPGFRAMRIHAQLGADGAPIASARSDQRAGPLTQTHNPLDLALADGSFLVVGGDAGERLVRGGTFRLDENGTVLDSAGRALLGDDGPIVLPHGPITIDSAGNIRSDDTIVARLRVERAPDGVELERDAAGSYLPAGERVDAGDAERGIRQGYLEGSNVSSIESLVEMLTVQRAFTSIQNSVRVLDGIQDRIANDIGRVG